jgi:hypothetical protein
VSGGCDVIEAGRASAGGRWRRWRQLSHSSRRGAVNWSHSAHWRDVSFNCIILEIRTNPRNVAVSRTCISRGASVFGGGSLLANGREQSVGTVISDGH